MNKPTAVKNFIFLVVFMILGFVLTFCTFDIPFTNYTYNGFANAIKLGLDIKGGVLLVGDASPLEDNESDADFNTQLNATVTRLSNILADEGYTEAQVTIQQGSKIRVEVPDIDDPEAVLNLIGTPAKIEFKLSNEDGAEAVITGQNIRNVYASYQTTSSSNNTPEWGVVVEFTAEGEQLFYDLTSDAASGGGKIYIYSNGELISQPTVESAIRGSTFISGSYDQESAEDFALQIMSGTFSVDISWGETSVISATLGVDALKYSLIAGIVGMILIFAFLCWRYKMMGFMASFALCFYVIFVMFLLQAIPFVQLTLEGIAGIILSIGMAIDANIIIFERIKEEYATGKRLSTAIKTGFRKGMPAIIDSNITTFIASIILMIFGTGSIQGFAMTLFIGVAVSMFTALVVTRGLINMYYALNPNKAEFYSLRKEVAFNDAK